MQLGQHLKIIIIIFFSLLINEKKNFKLHHKSDNISMNRSLFDWPFRRCSGEDQTVIKSPVSFGRFGPVFLLFCLEIFFSGKKKASILPGLSVDRSIGWLVGWLLGWFVCWSVCSLDGLVLKFHFNH